jgi:hypothetical protein
VGVVGPSYTSSLSFATSAVTIKQGDGYTFVSSNATLAAIDSGWTWYLDGTAVDAQNTPYYTLSPTTSRTLSGSHTVSARITYKGILYSGSCKLTVNLRSALSIDGAEIVSTLALKNADSTAFTPDSFYSILYLNGYLYAADTNKHCIYKINPLTGLVTCFAGNSGFPGNEDGTGTEALFNSPMDITTDGTNLYLCDSVAQTIRKITPGAVVTTVAGIADRPGAINAPVGTNATFNMPSGICYLNGYLYVCDWNNNLIRKIDISNNYAVTTYAGTGTAATTGGSFTTAEFNTPYRITTDGLNLYVTEYGGNCVRCLNILGATVTTILTGLDHPAGIYYDGTNLYTLDADFNSGKSRVFQCAPTTVDVTEAAAILFSTNFNYPKGICSDGVYLYVANTTGKTILRYQ